MVFLYLERSKFKFRKNGFCSPSDPPLRGGGRFGVKKGEQVVPETPLKLSPPCLEIVPGGKIPGVFFFLGGGAFHGGGSVNK